MEAVSWKIGLLCAIQPTMPTQKMMGTPSPWPLNLTSFQFLWVCIAAASGCFLVLITLISACKAVRDRRKIRARMEERKLKRQRKNADKTNGAENSLEDSVPAITEYKDEDIEKCPDLVASEELVGLTDPHIVEVTVHTDANNQPANGYVSHVVEELSDYIIEPGTNNVKVTTESMPADAWPNSGTEEVTADLTETGPNYTDSAKAADTDSIDLEGTIDEDAVYDRQSVKDDQLSILDDNSRTAPGHDGQLSSNQIAGEDVCHDINDELPADLNIYPEGLRHADSVDLVDKRVLRRVHGLLECRHSYDESSSLQKKKVTTQAFSPRKTKSEQLITHSPAPSNGTIGIDNLGFDKTIQ